MLYNMYVLYDTTCSQVLCHVSEQKKPISTGKRKIQQRTKADEKIIQILVRFGFLC